MEKLNRNVCRKLLLIATCALAIGFPCRLSAQSEAQKALLAKAQSLAAHGRLDMAVQTWQQVLLSDPSSKEALTGLARADMQLGKTEEAKKYLERLRAAGGSAAIIAQIEAMPHVQPQSERLNQASQLAQSGKYADAMRIYRDVFGNQPPPGNYALAYYDTEAALPEDRPHAVEGLRKLSKQFPADPRYAITLGRVLTYDPKTRAEGVAILQQYSANPAAQNALKQAASWNEKATTAASVPEPASARPKSAPAGNPLEASAYRALNSGRLAEAQQQFQQLLAKQPNNPRALSGMGYVYMKQQDFTAAADYLERARAAGARGLDSAIATSHFWARMASGSDELKAGNTEAAIEDYRAATLLKPSSPDALEALAGALMQQGNTPEAIDIFEQVVRIAPDRVTAWRGLFLAQSAAGDSQAALATNDRMPKSIHAQLNRDPSYLRSLAQDNLALGRKAEADRVVQRALALPFPNQGRDLPLDQQMQYAALLMTAQRYEPALQLYRQVIEEDPENLDAWRSLVAAQHQLHRDDEAIAAIGHMPQSVYDQVQNDVGFLVLVGSIYQTRHEWDRAQKYLERALTITTAPKSTIELQLADVYAAQGNQEKAYAIYRRELDRHPESLPAWRGLLSSLHQSNHDRDALHQLALMPESVRLRLDQDPSYLQTVASIQAATGQDKAALKTFAQLTQAYANQNMEEPADVQIQYGWVLLKVGDDRKLYALVSSVSNSPDLTDDQQADLNRLWAAWSTRRANNYLAAGDQRRAMAILEAAARAFPGNADVYSTLAGAYLRAGQPKRAVAIYLSLDMNHASLAQYQGAIGAALAANDMKQAEAWLQLALDGHKDDPTILKMAAQYEQARGNTERAAAYYRAALDAMGPASPGDMFSQPGNSGRGPGDPQNGLSPTQQLMELLAPAGRTAQMRESTDPAVNGSGADISWQDAPSKSVPTLGDFAQSEQDDRAGAFATAQNGPQSNDELSDPQTYMAAIAPASTTSRTQGIHRPVKENGRSLSVPANYAATLVDGEESSTSAEYIEPASMNLPPARSMVQEQDGARQWSSQMQVATAADPNPASSLQNAVRELDAQNLPSETSPRQDSEAPSGSQIDPGTTWNTPTEKESYPPASRELPPLTGPAVRVQPQKTPRQQIEDQLAVIQGASSGWLGGTSSVAYRSGQPGYDQLAAYSTPIESSSMLGSAARITVISQPVLLDSGTATGTETIQQGTLPKGAIPTAQSASGFGSEVQLRTSLFAASVGFTPRGFLVENVTGGIYIHPPSGHFTLTFARDPIFDTELSYAGLRDEGSATASFPGNVWGGVITNAGELQIASGDSHSGWYLQGGGQYITGVHVQDNTRFDGDAGAYWGVWHDPEYGKLTVGANFFGMTYAHNLRYFTYGQGGYFSPDAYVVAAVPLTFNGHYGPKFHYRVAGSIGIQAFNEEASPYFPLDPAIQAAQGNLFYPAMTSVGGNYNFDAEGSYAIAEHWYLGGYMSFNNSRDYASEKGGFFVRYLFRPQPMSEETGPTGLFPVQGFRPFQVP